MAEEWDKWKKPWSRDKCERRYVEGDKIGIRTLAEHSGRSHASLGKWSSEDDWIKKRERYQNDLRTQTREKTLEARSDAIAAKQVELLKEHSDTHEVYRLLARNFSRYANNIAVLTAKKEPIPQNLQNAFDFLERASRPLSLYMGIVDRAIAGERLANFMDYIDPRVLEGGVDKLSDDELMEALGEEEGGDAS